MRKFLCAGEALIDVVKREREVTEHVGGSILNVACGLKKLGHNVRFASWWANDHLGAKLEAYLQGAQIPVATGSNGAVRTTVATALIDGDGHATYEFDLEWDLPEISAVDQIGHLHVGSYSTVLDPGAQKVIALAQQCAQQAGTTLSYDPNIRPDIMPAKSEALRRVLQMVELADVVKASDEDLAWLYFGENPAEVAKKWLQIGPSVVVVTQGSKGATAYMQDGTKLRVPPLQIAVADTVGAGDSFMAGLLSGLADAGLLGDSGKLRGDSKTELADALQRAATTSAITVSHNGAYSPSRAEVSSFHQS
ncbi:MAG: carbohydrate kinase [Actinomycetaceae bacterium]|nr:carbohydrate kinase [Actinomycetaceae bacterium]